MLRAIVLLIATLLLTATACDGNWVKNYDPLPSRSIDAEIRPELRDEIVRLFRSLSDTHDFQIVVKDMYTEEGPEFLVMMRNRRFRIHAINNTESNYLSVGIYKAIDPLARPSDEELTRLSEVIREGLSKIEGVSLTDER